MRKPFTILLFLFSFLVCLGLSSDVATQTTSDDEGVKDVILDKTKAVLECSKLKPNIGYCNEENRKIRISTIAKDTEKKGLTFYYLAEGGKIIGRGANVVWDFSDAKPGKYMIAVGVGKDGIVQGNLITKTVSVYECECQPPCICPSSIFISVPTKSSKPNETVTFTATVNGGSQSNPTYNWKVSGGEIIKGQGTPEIVVKPLRDKKIKTIKATVDASGFCLECPNMSASSTVELTKK